MNRAVQRATHWIQQANQRSKQLSQVVSFQIWAANLSTSTPRSSTLNLNCEYPNNQMREQQQLDARSVVSLEDDERSICTSATTASLASRMQSLAVDFGPKHRQRAFERYVEDEEEEDVVSVTEEELLKELERQEPAFQVRHHFISSHLMQTPVSSVQYLSGCVAYLKTAFCVLNSVSQGAGQWDLTSME